MSASSRRLWRRSLERLASSRRPLTPSFPAGATCHLALAPEAQAQARSSSQLIDLASCPAHALAALRAAAERSRRLHESICAAPTGLQTRLAAKQTRRRPKAANPIAAAISWLSRRSTLNCAWQLSSGRAKPITLEPRASSLVNYICSTESNRVSAG